MPHFFVSPGDLDTVLGSAIVTGADAFHIIKVLRLHSGDPITLADGSKNIYAAQIGEMSRDLVTCRLTGLAGREEIPLRTTLVQGIPKGDKMDLVVQKAVELGVWRIVPLISRRTVARPQGEQKLVRWRRIALEAAKQCRRGIVPLVDEPRTMEQVLDTLPPDAVTILPWELEQLRGLGEVLSGAVPPAAVVMVGPEGGFAEDEVALAVSRGVTKVSLGPRILRSETAGIVTLALVLFRWGDLGWATKGIL